MFNFNPDPPGLHVTMVDSSSSFACGPTEAYDHESPSGSDIDEANTSVYLDPHKAYADLDDDSLTSQTLNPDGTPKRPMNAFMIFARRRRPQISAENQSMRTGGISKILSREWSSMDPSEKQFYLDQAKQLKDVFNRRYPDYVYKRRPNNTRRRRKPDSNLTASEQPSTAPSDYPDPSPDEIAGTDERRYGSHDNPHPNVPAGSSGSPYASSHQRGPTYQAGAVDDSYLTSHGGRQAPAVESGSVFCQPYSSSYFSDSRAGEGWAPSRGDATWSQSNQDHVHTGENRHRGYEHQTSRGWDTGPSDSGGTAGTDIPNYGFSTLNSPFFPSQGSYPPLFPASQTVPNSQYSAAHGQGAPQGRTSTAYDTRTYSSPPMHSPYHQGTSAAVGNYYPARNVLPSADYSLAPQPSGSGSGMDVSQQQHRYWSREPSDS